MTRWPWNAAIVIGVLLAANIFIVAVTHALEANTKRLKESAVRHEAERGIADIERHLHDDD